VGYLPLALPLPVALWIPGAAVAGLALPVVLTLVFQRVQLLCPPNLLTEANAWVITAFGVGAAVAALLAGIVTDQLRNATAIPTVVLAGAMFTAVVCLLSHRDDPLPAGPPNSVGPVG
jgi:predicted MFS family arabinose efflux permease